jgi:hypothetical protein
MEFNPDPKFPWKTEQVEEIASIFFNKAPARMSTRDKWAWAAREAVNYLNARRRACERALKRDKAISSHYDNLRILVEKRKTLPEKWPYEKAVKYITGENLWDRALKKFKQFAFYLNKGDTERAEQDLERFRSQKAIERSDVIDLRLHFVGFWEHYLKTQKTASGKKGGRPKKVDASHPSRI